MNEKVTGLYEACPICGQSFRATIKMLGVITVLLCGGGHAFARHPIVALSDKKTPFDFNSELSKAAEELFEKKKRERRGYLKRRKGNGRTISK